MSRETIELGGAPANEDCVCVVKSGDYIEAMRAEVARYILGLENHFAPLLAATSSLYFRRMTEHHDYGTYYEAGLSCDAESDECAIAWDVQDRVPTTWHELETTVSPWKGEREQDQQAA